MSDPELNELLKARLPRHAAPARLKARLGEQLSARRAPVTRSPRRWLGPSLSALAAAALVLVTLRVTKPAFVQRDTLFDEAVNDHLRVVASQHPVDIESNGIHNVKPWFTGRLDFAPPVAFAGDDDFPLRGGSVGYFGDRRAALFLYGRRLHSISLWVFPADGLSLPARAERMTRGFNVIVWRAHGLGYALVSDVSAGELETLESKLR